MSESPEIPSFEDSKTAFGKQSVEWMKRTITIKNSRIILILETALVKRFSKHGANIIDNTVMWSMSRGMVATQRLYG